MLRRLLCKTSSVLKDKVAQLGYEMRNMLRRTNHFLNFTYTREHEARLLNADLCC